MIKRGSARDTRAQVWVETVIYTLIGLTLMGIIIGVITPQINKMIDRSILAQTQDSMNKINEQVIDALSSVGSQRELSLSVRRGEYTIDGLNNNILFVLKDTGFLMSQPGEPIKSGELTLLTMQKGTSKYDIYLILNYTALGLNITYNDNDASKTFTKSPSPYRLLIINKGGPGRQMDISSIGG